MREAGGRGEGEGEGGGEVGRKGGRGEALRAILQLSGRYGSHEAAQPYRKWRAQGKGKDKQGQWHRGRGGGGWVCVCARARMQKVWTERMGGGGVDVQGLCVRWCFVGELLMFLLLWSR